MLVSSVFAKNYLQTFGIYGNMCIDFIFIEEMKNNKNLKLKGAFFKLFLQL